MDPETSEPQTEFEHMEHKRDVPGYVTDGDHVGEPDREDEQADESDEG